MTFPIGNIAPEGSVIKSTAIDPEVVGEDGVYHHTGRAKVFTTEKSAVKAIKDGRISVAGECLRCRSHY
ncbi:dihydroxy-acid dehydratase [Paenibacillus sp. MAHUQ-63]|nr:dihydroxy-acid dehydratase [Paenibacillus sp. MAHUQ-63]MDD9269688.1 dihydroxy-acid dehydratase [Paenibacillus sp. MAHUQ-63]